MSSKKKKSFDAGKKSSQERKNDKDVSKASVAQQEEEARGNFKGRKLKYPYAFKLKTTRSKKYRDSVTPLSPTSSTKPKQLHTLDQSLSPSEHSPTPMLSEHHHDTGTPGEVESSFEVMEYTSMDLPRYGSAVQKDSETDGDSSNGAGGVDKIAERKKSVKMEDKKPVKTITESVEHSQYDTCEGTTQLKGTSDDSKKFKDETKKGKIDPDSVQTSIQPNVSELSPAVSHDNETVREKEARSSPWQLGDDYVCDDKVKEKTQNLKEVYSKSEMMEAQEMIRSLKEELVQREWQNAEQIKILRAESDAARQVEIQAILEEATKKHHEEMKQRLAQLKEANERERKKHEEEMKQRLEEAEKANEHDMKITIEQTTRKVMSVTGKRLKQNEEDLLRLKTELKLQNEEIGRLKAELIQKKEQFEDMEKKFSAEQIGFNTLEMQLHNMEMEKAGLEEQVRKMEEEKKGVEQKLDEAHTVSPRKALLSAATICSTTEVDPEIAKEIKKLQLELDEARENCVSLEHEKAHFEDEREVLKGELERERQLKKVIETERDALKKELISDEENGVADIPKLMDRIQHLTVETEKRGEQIKCLTDELELRKMQAVQYQEDFKQERKDRERIAGHLENEKLKRKKAVVDVEKDYKEMKANLDLYQAEIENMKHVFDSKEKELNKQYHTLQEEHARLKGERVSVKRRYVSETTQLRDKLHLVTAEKVSLEEKVEEIEPKLKVKVENLEVAYKEKADIEKLLDRFRAESMAEKDELVGRMRQLEAQNVELTEEIQKSRQYTQDTNDVLAPFKLEINNLLRGSHQIGAGCYGSVYAIELNGVKCIAKRVQDILAGAGGQEDVGDDQRRAIQQKFRQECVLLSQIRHPNIVQFIGVCYGRDQYDLTLVMERLPIDLQKCLEKCQKDDFFIPVPIRVSILLDVTYGLLHLHNSSILHRDLTAANILLASDLRAKIADLGVSRIYERRWSQQLSKLPGTIAYMPPEALEDRPEYNLKLDVFSFGVLALFVALQVFPEFSWANVPYAIISKGERELYKRQKWISKIGDKHFLYPLIRQCLLDESEHRPSTAEINETMKGLSTRFPRQLKQTIDMLTQLDKCGVQV